MLKWPRIEKQLIDNLRKLYRPLPFDPDLTPDQFKSKSGFAAGGVEVVDKLESIYDLQQKERTNVVSQRSAAKPSSD